MATMTILLSPEAVDALKDWMAAMQFTGRKQDLAEPLRLHAEVEEALNNALDLTKPKDAQKTDLSKKK